MTGMSETDSCRLCAEGEESSEHLWLRCPAFIAERQRLGLGRTFDELVRIASAAENHLQAPAVTQTTTTTPSKLVPASTRLEDPSRKGTTRTAKSAPFNPCPSREGPYSTTTTTPTLHFDRQNESSHLKPIFTLSSSICFFHVLFSLSFFL